MSADGCSVGVPAGRMSRICAGGRLWSGGLDKVDGERVSADLVGRPCRGSKSMGGDQEVRALKTTMFVWGVVIAAFGLAFIFVPTQLVETFGYEGGPEWISAIMAGYGGCFIAASAFVLSAARNPLQNLSWVKFAIVFSGLDILTALYSVGRGYVHFGQAAMGIVLFAVFLVAFLALYPRGRSREE